MRTHTGDKPCKCELCHRTFAQGDHLKTHVRCHTGEKSHKCKLCQKLFAHGGSLKRHMRTHDGEKPYICVVCNKGFALIGNLRIHKRTHRTGNCNKPSAGSRSSAKRIQLHRGIQPAELKVWQVTQLLTYRRMQNRFWKGLLDVVCVVTCWTLRRNFWSIVMVIVCLHPMTYLLTCGDF